MGERAHLCLPGHLVLLRLRFLLVRRDERCARLIFQRCGSSGNSPVLSPAALEEATAREWAVQDQVPPGAGCFPKQLFVPRSTLSFISTCSSHLELCFYVT